MKINIQQIPEEGLSIQAQEPCSIIDVNDERYTFNENIHVQAMAYHFKDRLYVLGSLKTNVGLQCSRCLKNFTQAIGNEKFSCDCEIENIDVIDLTDRIREDIIVALPIQPLCHQACRGLCGGCGKDLNEGSCGCEKQEEQRQGPFDVLKNMKL